MVRDDWVTSVRKRSEDGLAQYFADLSFSSTTVAQRKTWATVKSLLWEGFQMDIAPEVLKEMEQVICGPARKRPRRKSKYLTTERLDPASRKALRSLTSRLVSMRPKGRRKWIATAQMEQPPAAVTALIETLIATLLRSTSPAVGANLVDTLPISAQP